MADQQEWVRLAGAASLGRGEMGGFAAGGRRIALYHLEDDGWRASDDCCTHGRARLTEGWLDGCEVECPLHAGRFDLNTGAGLGAPIVDDLVLYEVRLDGADVLVHLGEAGQ